MAFIKSDDVAEYVDRSIEMDERQKRRALDVHACAETAQTVLSQFMHAHGQLVKQANEAKNQLLVELGGDVSLIHFWTDKGLDVLALPVEDGRALERALRKRELGI